MFLGLANEHKYSASACFNCFKTEAEMVHFYEELRQILRYTTKEEITITMGDSNAKIGKGRMDKVKVEVTDWLNVVKTRNLSPSRVYTWRSS